jgi:hypothetical protein
MRESFMETEGIELVKKELADKKFNYIEKEETTLDDILAKGRPNWDAADEEFYNYKRFSEMELLISNLKFLHLGDLKKLTDKGLRAISFTIMVDNLCELSIWGCYLITNKGFLDLCMVNKNKVFKRINYCGCYKISDDSRMWICQTFKHGVLIYI